MLSRRVSAARDASRVSLVSDDLGLIVSRKNMVIRRCERGFSRPEVV